MITNPKSQQPLAREGYLPVENAEIYYRTTGQGEPIVMLHGGSRSGANVFSRNIPGLAKRFRVLAIDRLGYGLTDNPKNAADGGTRRCLSINSPEPTRPSRSCTSDSRPRERSPKSKLIRSDPSVPCIVFVFFSIRDFSARRSATYPSPTMVCA